MSIRSELAAAARRVNAAFYRCPEPRPTVIGETWSKLEAEIDAAITHGDDDRTLRAIHEWEAHARGVAARTTPVTAAAASEMVAKRPNGRAGSVAPRPFRTARPAACSSRR